MKGQITFWFLSGHDNLFLKLGLTGILGRIANMKEMLDFLNQNQGAVMMILTAVYVLATIVTVIFIYRSNKLVCESNEIARKTMEQSMTFEKERNRPYVIFDLEFEKNALNAVLKNIGQTPAIDVNIIIDEGFTEIHIDKKGHSFKRPISFMAPGRTLYDFVNTGPDIFKVEKPHIYNVKLKYKDSHGTEYEEDYVVDIDHNKGLTRLVSPEYLKDIASELKNSHRQLQEIRDCLDSIVWQHNSIVEKHYPVKLPEDPDFNASKFIKDIFRDSMDYDRKVYIDPLSYRQNCETEKTRNNILRCESMGLMRRERNYFVLTEQGHHILENK
jgi:hypothetical protein